VAFVSGLLLARSTAVTVLLFPAAASLLVLWQPWERLRLRLLALLVLSCFLGWARAVVDLPERATFGPGEKASCSGFVLESPRRWGDSLVFFFSVNRVNEKELASPSLVLVCWSGAEQRVTTGERWQLQGRFALGAPAAYPGGFSQAFWLWTQRAEGLLMVNDHSPVSYLGPPRGMGPRALAARIRLAMLERLEQLEDPGASALVAGVVFGDTQALPRDVQEQFRRTGTSHLLAASGMNVALLLGLLTTLARLLGFAPWRVAPALIPVAIGYAFLAGCAPSITRAAAAAVMGLLAACCGRDSGPWNSLCLSVWVLLLWEPRQVYDPGFQLSVAAVIGLIGGPCMDSEASFWKKSGLMTVSAFLLTLPIIWIVFGEISLTLLPANLILGPLVEMLFPLGLLLAVLPLSPLSMLVEAIARLSLWLVGKLSNLADPMLLARPEPAILAMLVVAVGLWVSVWSRYRWMALLLAGLALGLGQYRAGLAEAEPGELIIRRVQDRLPVFWLSSAREDLLILSAGWQEKRARQMIRDQGRLCSPQVKVLQGSQVFDVSWGAFRWGKVHPLLPKAPFTEVRTSGCIYSVTIWRPGE
jgi:ComEC/Rec2-related protein